MMRTKHKIVALLIILGTAGTAARSQEILDGYLMEAAQNNPGLKARFNEYLAALEKAPQVGALPDPQVSFGYFIQPIETRLGPQQAKISVSQMFPWFGTLGARKEAATEMAKAKYEAFEYERSQLFYQVKSNYYNLYFTGRARETIRENIAILQIFRKIALSKVESGLASAVDVLRVDIEISNLENQLALLRDTYFTQMAEFNNLLNVETTRDIRLPDSLESLEIAISREEILDSIQGRNPQLLKLDHTASGYNKQITTARRSGAPNIMIGAEYMFVGESSGSMAEVTDPGKDAFVFPMVGISIPIYRKKYNSMVREAQLMEASALNARDEKMNVLETTYEKANRDYQDADRRISLFRIQSERAEKALNMLQSNYETDGSNFEEVLRMERQLLEYRLELEKARADKNASIAFIGFLMGR